MRKLAILLIQILFLLSADCFNQNCGSLDSRAFIAPDTVCQGNEVVVTNTTPGNTFYWNFCTGNTTYLPDGINMGDPGGYMQSPYYIHTVKDSNLYYSFVSTSQTGELIRMFHGTDLIGYVDSVTNLGGFGVLNFDIRGMCTGNDNGYWYLFVVDGSTVLRLDFGNSLMNIPVPQQFVFSELFLSEKIRILKEGNEWIGFITDSQTSKLLRLRFGNTLANAPQIENAGLFLPLSAPCGFDLKQENGNWYMLVSNRSNQTISRLEFGASLLNEPDGEYLSGLGYLESNIDVTISQDCERTNAYVSNWVLQNVFMVHLQFDHGLAGEATAYPVGTTSAILNRPYGLSAIMREGDSLYMLVVNHGSSMISRMTFPVCDDASISTWEGSDPPPVIYNNPGNFNIILRVDEGTPNEQVFCQNVVVVPEPEFTLGPNLTSCDSDTAWLDQGPGFKSYFWSTGDSTRLLPVTETGTYWVEVVNAWDCMGRDSITVTVNETYLSFVDTTICYGVKYRAQGGWQTEEGIYYDTLLTIQTCDSILQTSLSTRICTLKLWIPTAFTPNGDGLNDIFLPVTQNVLSYHIMIFDRWGHQVFESNTVSDGWDGTCKGKLCASDVYSYIVFFESYEAPGTSEKRTGTVMLVK